MIISNVCFGVLLSFAEEIQVLYFKRPPYVYVEDNIFLHGLVGTPAKRAFEKAKLPYRLVEIPPKRQLVMIKKNSGKYCGLGWFKNKKREKFGKFTLPIYKDALSIALALSNNNKIHDNASIEDLIKNDNLILLVRNGFSYGKYIDEMIKQHHTKLYIVTADNEKILLMLIAGRGDYFLVSYEEALNLVINSDKPISDFNFIYPKNNKHGEYRYIFCSKKVSDKEIELLNRAIKQF